METHIEEVQSGTPISIKQPKRLKKIRNKCATCTTDITGVEKWDNGKVWCVKCFRVIEKERQKIKDEERKNWFKPGMSEDEYYHKIFDLFC